MSTISTIIIRRGPAGPAGPSGAAGADGAPGADGSDATVTTASIVTLLGLPTKANLAAANTDLAIGTLFYNTALSKLDITTA